ncbi:Transcription elongation factor 1-like protein [Smittium culicis]|uniref:Transcription elongation factor 1 homolog n=1 Tax=Smittium culicis TaxID=133412 RepID=A0A1R1WXL3_9FUNG|nr:Transcription elongation factor 1-like protein [Smittium culicis]
MGKRKSTAKLVKRAKPKLDTTFDCLFCNHEKSVTVQMSKEHKIGNLSYLSGPIDVYSEWIDACEEAKNAEANGDKDKDYRDRNDEYEDEEEDERDDDQYERSPKRGNRSGVLERGGISDDEVSDVDNYFDEENDSRKKRDTSFKKNRVADLDSEEDYSDN